MVTGTAQLKILLINDYPDVAGGAEEQLFREREMLRTNGHKAVVVGFSREDEDRDAGAEYVLPEPSRKSIRIAQKITIQPTIYRGLKNILRTEQPDIVHIHKNVNYPASVLLACKDYPIIKTHHDFTTGCPSGWAVYRDSWEVCSGGPGLKCVRHDCKSASEMAGFYGPQYAIKNRLQKQCIDTHLAPSQRLQQFLQDLGFEVENLPYPASEEFSEYATTAPGSESFAFTGRLTEEKGVQILLEAVQYAKVERDREISVDILGEGPYRTELESQTAELGLEDRVKFHGFVNHDRLPDLYKNARAVVVPSIWMENFPNVVIEALSMGRPVVGSDRGGIPELLGWGERGWVYDATDPKELTEVLIEAQDKPAEASKKGEAGLDYTRTTLAPNRVDEQLLETMTDLFETTANS